MGEVIAAVNGVDCSLCSTDQLADLLLGAEGTANPILPAPGSTGPDLSLSAGPLIQAERDMILALHPGGNPGAKRWFL